MTLDEFVDEGIKRCRQCNPPYIPTRFMQMRADLGTEEAIKRLMRNSEPQAGFKRMLDCDLREWTIEWAVAKRFPEKFQDKLMQANAIARLEGKLDA